MEKAQSPHGKVVCAESAQKGAFCRLVMTEAGSRHQGASQNPKCQHPTTCSAHSRSGRPKIVERPFFLCSGPEPRTTHLRDVNEFEDEEGKK